MGCLKCNLETEAGQVFCPLCLRSAAAAPVRADIPVVMPRRESAPRKSPAKKPPKPEETIAKLRMTIRRLWICVALLIVALSVAVGALGFLLHHSRSLQEIGQNYSTVSDTTAGS